MRFLGDGGWRMEDGGWRMEDGEWRMENGGWRMENGEWRMENRGLETRRLDDELRGVNAFYIFFD